MGCFDEGKFVAIRMIVLDSDRNPVKFINWMTQEDGLLDKMWKFFHEKVHVLDEIIFLKGNKKKQGFPSGPPYPRLSQDGAGPDRTHSTAAGANADFAWVTCWTSKQANQDAWSNQARPDGWDDIWNQFRNYWCHRGSRPTHGPPYDSVGASGLHPDPPGVHIQHHGRGAGCLVEGFEVVKKWPEA